MQKTVKLVSLTAVAILTAGILGGCATTAQVDCDANTDRINRMYQKTMSK
jgi:hypothetical protein